MIVVDASVAVKWAVVEPGRDEALKVLDLGQELRAPDLIFAELSNVMRRKLKSGEVTAEQALRALDGVLLTLAITPTAELWRDALEVARQLDHSVYDCFYLSAALGGGILVSADEVFLRKCLNSNFAPFVSSLADLPSRIARKQSEGHAMPGVLMDVQRLAFLMESTFETLRNVAIEPSESSEFRFVPSSVFAPAFDSPAYRRLVQRLSSISSEELAQLIALGWLGRSYHTAGDWPGLLANALVMVSDGFHRHRQYIVAQMPQVGDGLKKLGFGLPQADHDKDP